jgi:beta-N-acetylhexosaminidase
MLDTHEALPTVTASDHDLQSDLAPFAALRDAAMAMTCHVIFDAWDRERPATLSPTVIDGIIRQRVGFHGLLMTDDLDMKALSGDVPSRAADAIAAGCDIALNCWAKMDDMVGVAKALDPISTLSRARLEGAMDRISGAHDSRQFAVLVDQRDALLALA